MEVADRTRGRPQGRPPRAAQADGRLVLREIAQTPDEDLDAFQDIARHRYFNTNNLWVNLRALARRSTRRDSVLGLPMIVNRKTVDPSDTSSPAVYQLETAMGAAIGVFEGARALRVPRTRFAPVKTTNDLLGAALGRLRARPTTGHVVLAPAAARRPPLVDLDPDHYKLLGDFEARFPAGPPSLVECERLRASSGDVRFGARRASCAARVAVEGPAAHRGRRGPGGLRRPGPPARSRPLPDPR